MSIRAIDLPTLAQETLPARGTEEPRAGRSARANGSTRGASKTARRGRVYRGAARALGHPPAEARAAG